jgi:hypothetical protein
MRYLWLFLLFSFSSCQDWNSNSSDAEKYGSVSLTGSDKFKESYPILVRRCANCHTSSIHGAWAGYTDEQNWIDNDLVVPNDPDNSGLIQRIINTGNTDSDMPQGGSALPASEYSTLKTWIENIP